MAKNKPDIVIDAHELLLEKGYKKAETAAKKKPSAENMKALAATRKLLDDYRASKTAPGERPFKAIADVLEYLQAEGYAVQKTKLYDDKHRIKKQQDGSFTKKAVDEYADTYLEKLDGSDNNISDVARRKALAEAESAEHDAARKKRIEECANGKLILKTEAKQKQTAKLARLITAVDNLVYGGATEEAVEIVGGDMKQLPKMQDLLMERFKAILAEYSKSPIFMVPKKSMLEAEEFTGNAE